MHSPIRDLIILFAADSEVNGENYMSKSHFVPDFRKSFGVVTSEHKKGVLSLHRDEL